ncbi:hypothetical protein GGR42_003350 [Saonia flava]|uniref:Fibronectin type-III domain-containing protein n=1 Tax=Saonia flava TaxID=523696 RepID=A0A846R1L4_9FLAO|nr:hypothetical protein [Saonia flava]NJB72852.1 hypothetical protein [Saonia flava]
MKHIYKIGFLAVFFLLSCGGGGSEGDDTPPPPPPVPDPSAATLVFPQNNTECNEGTILNDTQSEVTFEWNASQNTDSYEVNITNLNTSSTQKVTATGTETAVTIARGTPYEWFVVSKANGTNVTATSSNAKFYNQGPGIENYAPFPADVVNPERGTTLATTTSVALEWIGSDVDDDIEEYEVLFGTDETPTVSLGTVTETIIDANVASGGVYYWRVITTDSQGNTSQSEIFEFRVN